MDDISATYAPEQASLARKKRVLEALMQQQAGPMQERRVGDFVVPGSIFEPLGKLAGMYFAQRGIENAEGDEKALAQRKKSAETEEQKRLISALIAQKDGSFDENAAIQAAVSNLPGPARVGAALLARQKPDKGLAPEHAYRYTPESIAAYEATGDKSKLRGTPEKVKPPTEAMQITDVTDPADPSRMLRVDARKYSAGSLGDSGVIGLAGKEPTAAKKEEIKEKGKQGLKETLDYMRGLYDELDQMKAIPSTKRRSASNIGSGIQSSGIGQFMGTMTGTEAQKTRDQIKSARLMLLQNIKEATGMTAQQMNSNVELKQWLEAVTDPARIYEANIGILDHMENKFLGAPSQSVPAARSIGQWRVVK